MNATSSTVIDENKIAVFQLKGSLFTLTVLLLAADNQDAFYAQLEAMVAQAPKFFRNAPIVIDLHKLTAQNTLLDLSWYVQQLRQFSLIPVGIRGGSAEQQALALEAGLAILPEAKSESPPAAAKSSQASAGARPVPQAKQTSKVIAQQVRSGQQIYAKGGDLIVLAPVSPGAELLADGHIHVYGPLRGRALAGISGDQSARIFCQSLEAELVSIAGNYWVKEDLKNTNEHAALQIYLEDDRLKIHYL